jgi:hypothetical protein
VSSCASGQFKKIGTAKLPPMQQDASTLTGFVTRSRLVDDVDATLAANQTVVTVTGAQRLERILDLHFTDLPPVEAANCNEKRAG